MKQKLTYIHSLYELYEVIGVIILTLSLGFGLSDLLSVDNHTIAFIICAIFWNFLFRFMEDNRKKLMAYVILFGLLAFLYVLLKLANIPIIILIENMITYGGGTYFGEHIKIYGFLLALFAIFCVGIISYFIYKIERIRIYLSAILIFILVLFSVVEIHLNKITIFFILFYLLMHLALICQKYTNNRKTQVSEIRENMKVTLYLMPFCFFMSVIIIFLPTKEEPLQWKFVSTFFNAATELVENIMSNLKVQLGENTEYNISFTGYSDNGDLGGEITPSDKVQLQINGKKSGQSIYLIGSVYDYYSGKGWEKTEKDIQELGDYEIDVYELLSALYQSDASLEEKQNLVGIGNVEIIYQNINTKTLFYPQKTFQIITSGSMKYKNIGPTVLFDKLYRNEISYKSKFLVIDYDDPIMEKIYRKKRNILSENQIIQGQLFADEYFGTKNSSFQWDTLPDNLDDYLSKRNKEINSLYTQLPLTVSERVKNLAETITLGLDNDYDKAKAVERYLNTYQYSLHPELPKEGQDYVEFFLFTSKTGYCTYFATSMAVLLRTIGIPTRYVEGFYLDYQTWLSRDCYQIPASNAHAWCEVYLEGVGWIPFEPTSNNLLTRYGVFESVEPSTIDSNYQKPANLPQSKGLGDSIEIKEKKTLNLKPAILIVLYIIIFFTTFFLGYYFLLQNQRKKRYTKSTLNEKIILELLQIVKLVEIQKNIVIQENTVTELFDLIKLYTKISETDIHKMRNIYMKLRYSIYETNQEQVVLYQRNRYQLEMQYLKDCGTIKKINFKMFQTII